ncbi:MAG: protein kinase [Bdellovibrionota bacterium]
MTKKKNPKPPIIDSFNFEPGRVLVKKYEVVSLLGAGWEGEVYQVKEIATGIERAIKLFFPHRDKKNKLSIQYAKKLHKLQSCEMVIQYQTQETLLFRNLPVTFLVSEYVHGDILGDFLKSRRGKRLTDFQGLNLLYALACGIEQIHNLREYHGDLHAGNIIVCKYGLGFELKLLDFYHWVAPKTENIHDDVCSMIKIFYDALGGAKHYQAHDPAIKDICCGLKKNLILKKFRNAGQLRAYLELIELD